MRDYSLLRANDPEVYQAVMQETARQRNKIELIASENFVSVNSTFPSFFRIL